MHILSVGRFVSSNKWTRATAAPFFFFPFLLAISLSLSLSKFTSSSFLLSCLFDLTIGGHIYLASTQANNTNHRSEDCLNKKLDFDLHHQYFVIRRSGHPFLVRTKQIKFTFQIVYLGCGRHRFSKFSWRNGCDRLLGSSICSERDCTYPPFHGTLLMLCN